MSDFYENLDARLVEAPVQESFRHGRAALVGGAHDQYPKHVVAVPAHTSSGLGVGRPACASSLL